MTYFPPILPQRRSPEQAQAVLQLIRRGIMDTNYRQLGKHKKTLAFYES